MGGRSAAPREVLKYVLAVAVYAALGIWTQRFLTFTFGLLYFVTALEVLPRAAGAVRRRTELRRTAAAGS
jgi:hypothetical protein